MVAARRRTTFRFLLQVIVALVAIIGVWSVLSIFPATQQVASAFLGSAAVLAVIAGLALSTPLGNLGSGVLLAFTQPVRLGDRITVQDHTGIVDQISLSYTALSHGRGSPDLRPEHDDGLDDPREPLGRRPAPTRHRRRARAARRVTQRSAANHPGGGLDGAAGGRARDLRPGGRRHRANSVAPRRRVCTVRRRRLACRERDPRADDRRTRQGRAASPPRSSSPRKHRSPHPRVTAARSTRRS